MTIYSRQMFNWSTASTTLTTMNAGTTATAGNYFPPLSGSLRKIVVGLGAQAATSLCQEGRIELSQEHWKPTRQEFSFMGFGLQTVAGHGSDGNAHHFTYTIEQPVQTDWPITGQVIFLWSPVTPSVFVEGYFTA